MIDKTMKLLEISKEIIGDNQKHIIGITVREINYPDYETAVSVLIYNTKNYNEIMESLMVTPDISFNGGALHLKHKINTNYGVIELNCVKTDVRVQYTYNSEGVSAYVNS